MRSPLSLTTMSLAALFLAACAGAPGPRHEAAGSTPPASVVVSNETWADVTVYVVLDGMPMRIGRVTGMHTERLRLPAIASGMSQVWLAARELGTGTVHTSPAIHTWAHRQFIWQLSGNAATSSLLVR